MIGNIENITDSKVKDTNILVFAFVGDSVYTTFIRSKISAESFAKSGKLNVLANKFVCAKGQSLAFDYIKDMLTEDESDIARTARNTSTKNIAKHSTIEDYKKATSFEALIGYLYMTGKNDRLDFILNKSFEKVNSL